LEPLDPLSGIVFLIKPLIYDYVENKSLGDEVAVSAERQQTAYDRPSAVLVVEFGLSR
jgi:hypothetical protein